MSILNNEGVVELTIPVGQKIAVSADNGATAIVFYSTFPNSPELYYEQTRITDGSTELGTFSSDKKVKLEAKGGSILYDVAVTPSILSPSELDQIKNIGSTTIDSTQWGYVGALNQGLATSNNVSFNKVTSTGAGNSDVIAERTSGIQVKMYSQVSNGGVGTFSNADLSLSANNDPRVKVKTNGNLDILSATGQLHIGSVKVVGPRGSAVADASGGATVDTEARTAINALLAELRTHGLIAT